MNMTKRWIAVLMTAFIAAGTLAGCGSGNGTTNESAAQATTQQASAEVAAEEEWMTDPQAYMSGIKASDYVELPADYAFLAVEVEPAAEVTDEEVEELIESRREADRELKEVTGRSIVREGDVVNIDYVGRIDGEEFDGGSDEGYDLEIGSGMFIDGFESGLIDQKVGDTVTLELTFPENYADSTKAGVKAEFDVTINSIQQYIIPDLTDDYVAGLGIMDEFGHSVATVDEYRAFVRNYLIERNERDYTSRLEAAIMDALLEKSVFKQDPPKVMVARLNDYMVEGLTSLAYQQYGTDLMTFMMKNYNSTAESYQDDIRKMAEEYVRESIILQAIADKENLSISDDELNAMLENAVNSSSGYTSVTDLPDENVQSTRERLNRGRAMDFLKSKTTVTAPASEEGSTGATAAAETEAAE
ncbi:MAG: trigger factor [Lachnospiraceae bacterium]|nr:trigger factor [Lachnospiraceae bacterium]